MIKTLLTTSALLVSLSTASFAMDPMACDDASVMKMEEGAKMMKDPAQKDAMMMAMKEVDAAKMAMKDGKKEDCSMHLDAAMKAEAPKM